MSLTAVHKALILTAVLFFALFALRLWQLAAGQAGFMPMAIFCTAASLVLAIYLAYFVRKTAAKAAAASQAEPPPTTPPPPSAS